MDSILYIVVGLVIILLVVVLIKRKNKAQQLSLAVNKEPTANRVRANSAVDRPNTNQSNPAGASGVTKFDNITVAQRFIDQQRYDKAIETLQRGLAEKPHDGALLLKLLNVYIITNQHDDFQQAYAIVQNHGDQETIAQAQQLKGLISEQHPVLTTLKGVSSLDMGLVSESSTTDNEVSTITPVAVNTGVDDDLAFDFDISQPSDDINAVDDSFVSSAVRTVDDPSIQDNSNDAFSLTLDDLEAADSSESSTDSFDISVDNDDSSTDIVANLQPSASDTTDSNTINLDDDFDFNFDLAVDNKLVKDDVTDKHSVDDNLAVENLVFGNVNNLNDIENELDLSSEFDFSTESATTDIETNRTFDANSFDIDDLSSEVSDTSSQKDSQQLDNNEFFLDFEANDSFNIATDDADATNIYASSLLDNESENALVNSVVETVSQPDATSFDDEAAFDFDIADSNVVTEDTVVTSTSPTFDDHTLIDDDFIFDTDNATDTDVASFVPVITEPVVVESEITSHGINDGTALDFDSQFAADFDFVKTLDSNQVTLDLADQYLQLGEYDSARRLLEEVIAQGNSEQQQQAQTLLPRTA